MLIVHLGRCVGRCEFPEDSLNSGVWRNANGTNHKYMLLCIVCIETVLSRPLNFCLYFLFVQSFEFTINKFCMSVCMFLTT